VELIFPSRSLLFPTCFRGLHSARGAQDPDSSRLFRDRESFVFSIAQLPFVNVPQQSSYARYALACGIAADAQGRASALDALLSLFRATLEWMCTRPHNGIGPTIENRITVSWELWTSPCSVAMRKAAVSYLMTSICKKLEIVGVQQWARFQTISTNRY
jgi:hypothetical protein